MVGTGKAGWSHLMVARELLGSSRCACFSRSQERREQVESLRCVFFSGSLQHTLKDYRPSHVIVATPVESLVEVGSFLVREGVPFILLEKPGTLTLADGQRLSKQIRESKSKVYVGYNRRHYASVRWALEEIKRKNERVLSLSFDFTELPQDPSRLARYFPKVLQRWVVANCVHVIDLAFVPSAPPIHKASCYITRENLTWHPDGAIFCGAGLTELGAAFSYHANWLGAGSWSVEWITETTHYILKPLERLFIQRKGSLLIEESRLSDQRDILFKPGFLRQAEIFLSGDMNRELLTFEDNLKVVEIAYRIACYPLE